MQPLHLTLHNLLTRWEWSPFPLAVLGALILVGTWYMRADWKLALRGRRWRGHRTISFFAGLLAVDLAFQSPVASFAMAYFQSHVIQHLLLMVVAPPLLALGAPSTLLLQTASRSTKTRWLAVLRSRSFAVLTHPVVVWSLYFGTMFVFFLSPLINVAMNHMALMDVINVIFLLGGLLFWWPLVGIDPILHWKMSYGLRLITLLIGAGVETFLGISILGSSRPEASMYTLAGTHSGGGMLWAASELAIFVGLVPIFIQWVRTEERLGVRADANADRRARAQAASARGAPGQVSVPNGDGSELRAPTSAWEEAWMAKFGWLPAVDAGNVAAPDQPIA
jgi:putative membrane protein